MEFLGLCKDPLVTTLRKLFDANIVRMPEERIQPLCVVAVHKKSASFRGALEPLIAGEPPLQFSAADFSTSRMADVSGKRSRRVKLDLGLQVLEGFLQGFGIPSAGICAKLEGASEVSFSFKNVNRVYVDINHLGQILTRRRIQPDSPASSIFADGSYTLCVIDSVITSSDFSISVDSNAAEDFKLDVPAILKLVAEAKVDVEVSTSSGYDLIFQGNKPLSFAYSLVRFSLDEQGTILSILPESNEVMMGRNAVPTTDSPQSAPSPSHVLLDELLYEQPGLLGWDE